MRNQRRGLSEPRTETQNEWRSTMPVVAILYFYMSDFFVNFVD